MEQVMGEIVEMGQGYVKRPYEEFKAEMDAVVERVEEGFVVIGYQLKVARDTDVLQGSGYADVNAFAEAEYDLDRSTVSRFIRINDRFSEGGNSRVLRENYRGSAGRSCRRCFCCRTASTRRSLPGTVRRISTPYVRNMKQSSR